MVFVQTKKQAHRLHILLGLLGARVGELHGNLTQPQRLDALKRFKEEQIDVLIATDVAARGLDISGVKTVVNFVMPATIEHYIHRVGRTARAGRAGVSVSLAGEQERKIVKDVIKKARTPVKSRSIPTDIIEKYRVKLQKMEPEISKILEEEREERMIAKAENQANRAEKLLNGEIEHRPWFQTTKQRKEEKQRLTLKPKQKKEKEKKSKDMDVKELNARKKKGVGKETPEDRANKEIEKVALLQARLTKKKHKLKKIRSCPEEKNFTMGKKNLKRKKSNFVGDLCDVSKKGVKKARYEGNAKKFNGKGKNKGAKGKGKAFGKPQQKKK